MVDSLQITSAIAGFGSSIALMYFTLSGYTYPKVKQPFFDDAKIFKFFALGIVLGMVLFAFESWGRPTGEILVALVVMYAVMEELMKLIILNFPRFQRKVDTAFYGLALGLGIATTYTFASVYASLLDVENPGLFEMVAYSLLGLQFVLLHGATTTMIGVGVVRRDLKGYFSEALLVHLGYNLLMIPFFTETEPWNLMGVGAASALVLYAYYRIHTQSLPALIRDAKHLSLKKAK
jgi:RsiW-degrading membrane proteinase PrsW (M82 family)